MVKRNGAKSTLVSSLVVLALLISMFIGTTFAWFTDSATSTGNIIKSGTLDVEMYWAHGTEDPETAIYTDASEGAIFKYELWEPGYTEVRHIKIKNTGTLDIKYKLDIVANGKVSELSDVIDVYHMNPAQKIAERKELDDEKTIGSLTDVLNNLSTSANGSLKAGKEIVVTLALKMQETAGNKYQELGIGSDFAVKLFATQLASESDSFNNQYDENANYKAEVKTAEELTVALANGEDVVLGANIVLDENNVTWDYNGATNKAAHLYIPENAELTLDLNGYTLTNTHVSPTVRHDVIANYGTLTLTDSEGRGKLISDNNSENVQVSGGFAVCSYGDLNLQNVTIDGNTGSYTIYVDGVGKTLTVDNATVSGRGALAVYNGAHAVVNSGKFSIDVLTSNARDNVLFLYNSTADVYGGSFDGTLKILGSNDSSNWKGSSCVMLTGTSTANIYGGSYVAREADLFSHDSNCAIYVYDGSFNTVNALGNSPLHEHNSKALVEVYGGTFIYDPSDYLGTGYKVIQNNDNFTVVAETTTE